MIKKNILSKQSAQEKLHRMALEIAENINDSDEQIILIGIEENGLAIAKKIESYLKNYHSSTIKVLSVSFNKLNPEKISLTETIDFDNKNIVVIDDVSNSGKTLLYALKPLLNYHPKRIQTLVMIERMHKLFPIKPDYVGLSLATTAHDHIKVVIEAGEIAGVSFV